MSIEVMKLALDALERGVRDGYWNRDTVNASTVLRQAIEQTDKQEPFWFAVVSNMSPVINKAIKSEEIAHEYADKCRANYDCDDLEVVPLYTFPPPRQPLTDEEIDELSRMMVKSNQSVNWLCRAIETKLKDRTHEARTAGIYD